MDKRSRLKVLDGRRRASGALKAAAYRGGGEHADERAVALARVLAVMIEGIVQVAIHIPMGPMGNITVDQLPDRIGVGFQIVFERGGRLFDACEDF